jgi:hypothetical protein
MPLSRYSLANPPPPGFFYLLYEIKKYNTEIYRMSLLPYKM